MSDENTVENRTLVISNFRNLGPFCGGKGKENNDNRAFLKINRSLEIDALGGLVTIVGVNNSGKSNVLDALEKYQTRKFTNDDYTDFTFAEKVKPDIGMNVANGAYGQAVKEKSEKTIYKGDWSDVLCVFLLEKESYEAYSKLYQILGLSYEEYAKKM